MKRFEKSRSCSSDLIAEHPPTAGGAAAGSTGSLPSSLPPRSPNSIGRVATPLGSPPSFAVATAPSTKDVSVQCDLFSLEDLPLLQRTTDITTSPERGKEPKGRTGGTISSEENEAKRLLLHSELAAWRTLGDYSDQSPPPQQQQQQFGSRTSDATMDNLAFWLSAVSDHLLEEEVNNNTAGPSGEDAGGGGYGYVRLEEGQQGTNYLATVPEAFVNGDQPYHCPACSSHLLDPNRNLAHYETTAPPTGPLPQPYPTNVMIASRGGPPHPASSLCSTPEHDETESSAHSSARGGAAVAGLPSHVLEELLYGSSSGDERTPRMGRVGTAGAVSTGTMTPRVPFSLGNTPRLVFPQSARSNGNHQLSQLGHPTPRTFSQASPWTEDGKFNTPVSSDGQGGFPAMATTTESHADDVPAPTAHSRTRPNIPKLPVVRIRQGGTGSHSLGPSSPAQLQPAPFSARGGAVVTPMKSVGSTSSLASWSMVSPSLTNATANPTLPPYSPVTARSHRPDGSPNRHQPSAGGVPSLSGSFYWIQGTGSRGPSPLKHRSNGTPLAPPPPPSVVNTSIHSAPLPPGTASTCTYTSNASLAAGPSQDTLGATGSRRRPTEATPLALTNFIYTQGQPAAGAGFSYTPRSIVSSNPGSPKLGIIQAPPHQYHSDSNPTASAVKKTRTVINTTMASSGGNGEAAGSSRDDLLLTVDTPRVKFSTIFTAPHQQQHVDRSHAQTAVQQAWDREHSGSAEDDGRWMDTTSGSPSGSPASVTNTEPGLNSNPASPVDDLVATSSPTPLDAEKRIKEGIWRSTPSPVADPLGGVAGSVTATAAAQAKLHLIPSCVFATAFLLDGARAVYAGKIKRPLATGRKNQGEASQEAGTAPPVDPQHKTLLLTGHVCRLERVLHNLVFAKKESRNL